MRPSPVPVSALAVIALAVTGSSDTCRASLSEPGAPQLEFTVAPGDGGEVRVDSVSTGQVIIRGGIGTPNPCYEVAGALEPRGSTLSISVVATARPVVCIQMLGAFAYRARIHGLAAGHYTLELMVTYPGTGWQPEPDTLEVDVP